MKRTSLKNLDAFRVIDEKTGETFYGCNQEWFGAEWQRLAGCGPSVVCNLLLYHKGIDAPDSVNSKESCLALMEEVWEYVRPTPRGIPSTELLCGFVKAYAMSVDAKVKCAHCEVPDDKALRPSSDEIDAFIGRAIESESPVAFLNLCNGDEDNLDEWHWVTIVSLSRPEPGRHAYVRMLDKGAVSEIDLTLWLETTQNGGGFVYFTFA